MNKVCNKCQEEKPLEDFQKKSSSKDGHTGNCKSCKREYDNEHYRSNPDRRSYIRKNSDNRIREVRVWILNYLLIHPCIDCGETDVVVLEFDHREDKLRDISGLIRTGNLETVKAEVSKCDVRCANDHRRKTAKDLGSWRLIALEALR
jgi:hypothetical protein